MDAETREPIPFVNVYFNASYKGTTTEMDGTFVLDVTGFIGQGIIISYVGYESITLTDYKPEKTLEVFLKPSTTMLQEIVVEYEDDLSREKKEKMFLKEFLGVSSNARSCEVENLEDVSLLYYGSSKTLRAYSSRPIVIRNNSLGFQITYFLDLFVLSPESMIYQGNSLIRLDSVLNEEKTVNRRRRNTYDGSRMHFIRTLWTETETDDKFELIDLEENVPISYNQLKSQKKDGELKSISWANQFKVMYRGQTSYVSIKPGKVTFIGKNGFFDPQYITWGGHMAEYRVGDLLPYEYSPK